MNIIGEKSSDWKKANPFSGENPFCNGNSNYFFFTRMKRMAELVWPPLRVPVKSYSHIHQYPPHHFTSQNGIDPFFIQFL